MKVIIVMPYYNRYQQLINTLKTINQSKHSNFEVIVIDDASNPSLEINEKFDYDISIIHISKYEKDKNEWVMPLPQMNRGMKMAIDNKADIVILQNCECRHYGDVITYAVENINESNYISFGCFSMSEDTTFNEGIDIMSVIEQNNKCATDDQHDSWYNHPILRGCGYDFCAAITVNNLKKLNGYDERYCHNYCYGDDDFLMRIKRLGLHIDITTNPIVLHQWHGNSYGKRQGIEDNRKLYEEIANTETGYKAKHLYTPDL